MKKFIWLNEIYEEEALEDTNDGALILNINDIVQIHAADRNNESGPSLIRLRNDDQIVVFEPVEHIMDLLSRM